MKRFISVVIVCILVLALAAGCGKKNSRSVFGAAGYEYGVTGYEYGPWGVAGYEYGPWGVTGYEYGPVYGSAGLFNDAPSMGPAAAR